MRRENMLCVCASVCIHMYVHPCVQIDKCQWEGNQTRSGQ